MISDSGSSAQGKMRAESESTSGSSGRSNLRELRRVVDGLAVSRQVMVLAVIVGVGVIARLWFVATPGNSHDMATFLGWVRSASAVPPRDLYRHDPSINYPPAYAVILELTAWAYTKLDRIGRGNELFPVLIKVPSVVFDLIGAIVAFILVRRFAPLSTAFASAAYFSLNPSIVYVSAYWGQLDSIPIVTALIATALLLSDVSILAWPILALAALVKPPILILTPLFLIFTFSSLKASRKRLKFVGPTLGIALALGLTETLAWIFFPHHTIIAPIQHLLKKIHEGSSEYTNTSLNAFNVWAMFQDFFASDRVHWGPLIMKHWAQASFVTVGGYLCCAFAWRPTKSALLESAFLLFLAFFLFMPEMHERYQLYATMFAGVLIYRRDYAIAAGILSLTLILSLEYALTYMYLYDGHVNVVNVNEFAPWLVHLCVFANLIVFGFLAARFSRPFVREIASFMLRRKRSEVGSR